MQLQDFLAPTLLGPLSYGAEQLPNGVHCFGLVIDADDVLIAGIFGSRPLRMEQFRTEILSGLRMGVQGQQGFMAFRSAGEQNYRLFEHAHKDGLGELLLVLHRAALLGEPLAVVGDEAHFYALAPVHAGRSAAQHPQLDLWARRMQDVLSLPILPAWHAPLWRALCDQQFALPCRSPGGFGPVWDVAIEQSDWQALVRRLVRGGQLTLPGTSVPGTITERR